MADTAKAIEALKESRPPATDRFTYLTIIEQFLSPDILPTLNEILQDAQLTQEIGWDLVDMLISLTNCGPCLETVARLGNPREVILKVLESLEGLQEVSEEDEKAEGAGLENETQQSTADTDRKFITLLGMLAILHKRIKTKRPSRFLASSLLTVYRTYRPNQQMTASVINLVHSLSGHKRPALPTRKSSVNVTNPDPDGDNSKNAPDPEADDKEDPTEAGIQQKLLLSFVTCILESFVNANGLQWSRRLLEYYSPDKIVPGRKTALQAFREDQELLNRDAMIGQLVALTRDLGLTSCSTSFIRAVCDGPISRDPLAETEDVLRPDDIHLSTGGAVCLMAYWAFSSTVFEANDPQPIMHIFPDHFLLLEKYLEDDAQGQIFSTPGTIEAIIVLGLWLEESKLISEAEDADFMPYHHQITLCSVYHPDLHVRNAAVILAGHILHSVPNEDDRLKILEDLLENCMFASLKACALTWLREELISAHKEKTTGTFSSPDSIELVQYLIFPNMALLEEMDDEGLLDYWVQNSAFVIQAANFAYFLFNSDTYQHLIPAAMRAGVEQRYVEPLLAAATKLEGIITKGTSSGVGMSEVALQLDILQDRLKSLSLH